MFSRPFGGYLGDIVYRYYGVPGKKYLVLGLGLLQGAMSLAWGLYIDRHHSSLAVVIVLMIITGAIDEMGNGANFSLVPHCNPSSNGLMTGIVGAMGNLGGVWFALVFRFQPSPFGKAFWISGVVIMVCSFECHARGLVLTRLMYRLQAFFLWSSVYRGSEQQHPGSWRWVPLGKYCTIFLVGYSEL